MKTNKWLITSGILNFLHGGLHLFQFIQSLFLIGIYKENEYIHSVLESPFIGLLWAVIGGITLWLGIKDFLYHRKKQKKDSFLRPSKRPWCQSYTEHNEDQLKEELRMYNDNLKPATNNNIDWNNKMWYRFCKENHLFATQNVISDNDNKYCIACDCNVLPDEEEAIYASSEEEARELLGQDTNLRTEDDTNRPLSIFAPVDINFLNGMEKKTATLQTEEGWI